MSWKARTATNDQAMHFASMAPLWVKKLGEFSNEYFMENINRQSRLPTKNCLCLKWVESQSYLLKQCRPKTVVSWFFPSSYLTLPCDLKTDHDTISETQHSNAVTWLFQQACCPFSKTPPSCRPKLAALWTLPDRLYSTSTNQTPALESLWKNHRPRQPYEKKRVKSRVKSKRLSLSTFTLFRGKDNGNLKLTWCYITAMSNMLISVLLVCSESWKFFTTDVSDRYVRPFIQQLI